MDIACPNCAATYRVPEALLAQGKALRCAACGHEWVPAARAVQPPAARPAEADVAPPPPPEPPALPEAVPALPEAVPALPEAVPALPEAVPVQRPPPPTTPPPLQRRAQPGQRFATATGGSSGRLLPLAWLASVTCLLLALLALVVFGEEVAAAWPPFARITALITG